MEGIDSESKRSSSSNCTNKKKKKKIKIDHLINEPPLFSKPDFIIKPQEKQKERNVSNIMKKSKNPNDLIFKNKEISDCEKIRSVQVPMKESKCTKEMIKVKELHSETHWERRNPNEKGPAKLDQLNQKMKHMQFAKFQKKLATQKLSTDEKVSEDFKRKQSETSEGKKKIRLDTNASVSGSTKKNSGSSLISGKKQISHIIGGNGPYTAKKIGSALMPSKIEGSAVIRGSEQQSAKNIGLSPISIEKQDTPVVGGSGHQTVKKCGSSLMSSEKQVPDASAGNRQQTTKKIGSALMPSKIEGSAVIRGSEQQSAKKIGFALISSENDVSLIGGTGHQSVKMSESGKQDSAFIGEDGQEASNNIASSMNEEDVRKTSGQIFRNYATFDGRYRMPANEKFIVGIPGLKRQYSLPSYSEKVLEVVVQDYVKSKSTAVPVAVNLYRKEGIQELAEAAEVTSSELPVDSSYVSEKTEENLNTLEVQNDNSAGSIPVMQLFGKDFALNHPEATHEKCKSTAMEIKDCNKSPKGDIHKLSGEAELPDDSASSVPNDVFLTTDKNLHSIKNSVDGSKTETAELTDLILKENMQVEYYTDSLFMFDHPYETVSAENGGHTSSISENVGTAVSGTSCERNRQ